MHQEIAIFAHPIERKHFLICIPFGLWVKFSGNLGAYRFSFSISSALQYFRFRKRAVCRHHPACRGVLRLNTTIKNTDDGRGFTTRTNYADHTNSYEALAKLLGHTMHHRTEVLRRSVSQQQHSPQFEPPPPSLQSPQQYHQVQASYVFRPKGGYIAAIGKPHGMGTSCASATSQIVRRGLYFFSPKPHRIVMLCSCFQRSGSSFMQMVYHAPSCFSGSPLWKLVGLQATTPHYSNLHCLPLTTFSRRL